MTNKSEAAAKTDKSSKLDAVPSKKLKKEAKRAEKKLFKFFDKYLKHMSTAIAPELPRSVRVKSFGWLIRKDLVLADAFLTNGGESIFGDEEWSENTTRDIFVALYPTFKGVKLTRKAFREELAKVVSTAPSTLQ